MSRSVDETERPDFMEQVTAFLENATTFIFKNCYIFMNVAMMVRSFQIKKQFGINYKSIFRPGA